MPALETSGASPASPVRSTPNKSSQQSPHPLQSLAAFSASGPIPSPPPSTPQPRDGPPASPPSYNSSVYRSPSPAALHRTADIPAIVRLTSSTPLSRPSTSPAALSSPEFALAAELREAHQQLLIQKHAIAAALGAELTALKEERARERRQHAVVMRTMEEEVRRVEERAHLVQIDNDNIRAELEEEKERRQHETNSRQQSYSTAKPEEESEVQHSAGEDSDWEETSSEAAGPTFHSQPPSSRPSISCPQPARQSVVQSAAQLDDDVTMRQMLEMIQQLSQQIAAIRLQSVQPKREHRLDKAVSEAEAAVYGPGNVWRQYEPLMFSPVQPIVFHRKTHYSHYDVNKWGR